jgi:hypothetical protein
MMLKSLRPREGANLVQLKGLFEGRGWQATLPSALPDTVLLGLARDLRSVECSASGESDEEPELPAPMYVVLKLLMEHPARGSDVNELELSQQGMTGALQAYQWAIEREIVTRIVGMGSSRDAASLVVAVNKAAKQ